MIPLPDDVSSRSPNREVVPVPVMSKVEAAFCRSGPWQAFTAKVVMPWVLHGEDLAGDVLEIGLRRRSGDPRGSCPVRFLEPADAGDGRRPRLE